MIVSIEEPWKAVSNDIIAFIKACLKANPDER
jgi:hypothetical protein